MAILNPEDYDDSAKFYQDFAEKLWGLNAKDPRKIEEIARAALKAHPLPSAILLWPDVAAFMATVQHLSFVFGVAATLYSIETSAAGDKPQPWKM